jgi:hypothetical protein
MFKKVKAQNEVEETLNASAGSFDRFTNRVQLHNVKIIREAACHCK